jgi:hypothetical protein
MSYDPIKWHFNEMPNLPRKPWSKLLMGAGLATMLGWSIVFPVLRPDATVGIPGLGFGFLAVIGTTYSPFNGGAWITRESLRLDEFGEQAINRATKIAFRSIVILAALLCFWCNIGISLGFPVPRVGSHWSQWAWTFFAFGLALPVLIAEIIIPLPPREDVGEDA